jgi:hypothetical protein
VLGLRGTARRVSMGRVPAATRGWWRKRARRRSRSLGSRAAARAAEPGGSARLRRTQRGAQELGRQQSQLAADQDAGLASQRRHQPLARRCARIAFHLGPDSTVHRPSVVATDAQCAHAHVVLRMATIAKQCDSFHRRTVAGYRRGGRDRAHGRCAGAERDSVPTVCRRTVAPENCLDGRWPGGLSELVSTGVEIREAYPSREPPDR